ncbi:MAG: beta strand repeat-containing protein [Gammaproteobacteria bacterium]
MSNKLFRKAPLAIAVGTALSAMVFSTVSHACTPDGSSQTYTVDSAGDDTAVDGVTTLREALADADANAGCHIIDFDLPAQSTVTLDGLTNGPLTVSGDVNIQGPGSGQLTVTQASAGNNVLNFDADTTVSGLTVSGAANGYGIRNFSGDTTLDDVVVQNNGRTGISLSGGSDKAIVIVNSTVTNNSNGGNGGGIAVRDSVSSVTIENSTISSNTAVNNGAGIYISTSDSSSSSSSITIRDTQITGNSNPAVSEGGGGSGIYLRNNSSTETVDLTIEDSVISNNEAQNSGPGLNMRKSQGTLNVSISDTTIADNTLTERGGGGAMFLGADGNATATLSINDSTLSGNSNTAPRGAGQGGALYLDSVEGGAITATITQSTFSENIAREQGGALAMNRASGSTLTAEANFSTITENSADTAGGIYNPTGANMTLNHTIVAGNTTASGDDDLNGDFATSYAFIGVDSANASITDDGSSILSGGDPDLGALADPGTGNGTAVHIPNENSNVIDAGNPALTAGAGSTPGADQRAGARVALNQIDIGSVEYNPNVAPRLTSSISSATVEVGANLSLDLSNFFADPNGDALTYAILNPADIPGSIAISGSVATGAMTASDVGSYTIQYQVCDAEPLCVLGSGELTVQQAPTTAVGGSSDGGGGSIGFGLLSLLASLWFFPRRR